MGQSSLASRSILVVEAEPFIASCLEMILHAAGANVRRAASSSEGLIISDHPQLSAAVLDFNEWSESRDVGIARRLTERGLPFMLYGGHAGGRYEAWPHTPLVSRLASGIEIVETLRALILPPQSKPLPVVPSALGAPE
jgi:CheY-like chemotaxis protein